MTACDGSGCRPTRHEPHRLTLAAARDGLRARQFTARELTEAHLAAIEALNPRLNAFITVTGERALTQADAADAALARGEFAALTGIPLAIKDLFCTEGVRTTAGSKILEPVRPALRKHGQRQPAARRRDVPRQDQHGRVRHGLVEHDLGLWPGDEPLDAPATPTAGWCRAARPAARRRRWRRGWRWARPAPIPAARSASPPRSAASSA